MNGLIKAIRADWVFSPDGWLEGGWLLVDAKSGEVVEFSRNKPSNIVGHQVREFEGCALLPGFVNAHVHLELSGFPGHFSTKNYFSWVRQIIAYKTQVVPEELETSFERAIEDMFSSGTQGCGDVTNIPLHPTRNRVEFPGQKPKGFIGRHIFWELIGFNVRDIVDCLNEHQKKLFLEREKTEKLSLIPHAVYSTSASLIKQLFRWSRSRKKPFSIHIGEHLEERQFLMEGKGPCRELLEELGKWNPRWSPPKMSPVKYLDSLGTLDRRTMLVHCVHLTEEDWDIAAKRNCPVCFCVRSNHFLNVGYPNINRALERNIKILLGTDSLASNEDLSMVNEIEFIYRTMPSLKADDLLNFATYNGMDFFNIPPIEATFLTVELDGHFSPGEIGEMVLEKCFEGKFSWIHQVKSDLEE